MSKQYTSKYIAVYGMTLSEIGRKFNKTRQAIQQLHKRGRLKEFLSDPEEFEIERYSKTNTIYVRAYGMKQKELEKFLGFRQQTLSELHRSGLLRYCVDIVKQRS